MKKTGVVIIFLLTAACTQAPFVDMRREAGKPYTVGESTPDTVAVCFNKYSTHTAEIIRIAQEECKKTNREAKFKDINRWSCRVLLPHRVYFDCVEPPAEALPDLETTVPIDPVKPEEPLERLPVLERPAR